MAFSAGASVRMPEMTMGSFSAAGVGGLQLLDERLHQLGVLLLGHEEGALEDVAALGGGDLRANSQQLVDLPHGVVVAVVDLDGVQQLLLGEGAAQLFQVADDALIAGLGIGHAVGGLAVLGIGHGDEGDGRHGVLPVLAHGLEGIAQGGDDDSGRALVGTVDAQLQQGLDNGAQEGGTVFLGAVQRHIAAPGSHRHEAHGVDKLLRECKRERTARSFCPGPDSRPSARGERLPPHAAC